MRSLKSRSGLTHGSGMNEIQRNVWLLSAPVVATIKEDMLSLLGVSHRKESSEQHKECGVTRKGRDVSDASKFASFFVETNPFHINEEGIMNLANGEVYIFLVVLTLT